MSALNVRQRIDGSLPEMSTRSRGARGTRAAKISTSGHSISRVLPVGELDLRARRLEVEELLRVDAREAGGAEAGADERQGGRGRVAGVVPALEGADQGGGAKAVRPALPFEGRHPIQGRRWALVRPSIATLRAGQEVAGVFACTRKDRLVARTGSPYLAVELRDRTGHDRRARVPRRRRARRALRARRPRAGARARRALPRRAADRARRHRARAPRARPTRRRSCRSPTATSRSSTASSSTSPREVHDTPVRRAARAAARRRGAARRVAPRAVHARRPPRLPRRAARAHGRGRAARRRDVHAARAPEQRPAHLRRARARPRQDPRVHLRRGDRGQRRGPAARPRRARPRAAARARRRRRSTASACSRCRTACSPTTAPTARPARRFASAEALALYRLNALDAAVKGALEHGLP